jgi:hypothetical protein
MVNDQVTVALRRMIFGQMVCVALGSAARLGIPDLLADAPMDAEQIARASGAHAPSMRRLLRALVAFGVFEELPDGRFELTPLSQALRADVPGSMHSMAAMIGGGPTQRAWADALHSILTGTTATEHVYGHGVFDVLATDPAEADIFNRAMTENTAIIASELLAAYDFSRFSTIVDVGGGQGLLLAEVLRAHPTAHGILFDLPEVVAGAPPVLERAGVSDRCQVAGGSFFDDVPAGGDLYMMKAIVHAFDDDRAAVILRNCRERMAPSSRVAVLDRVMPERITTDEMAQRAVLMDMNMLVLTGGHERTEREFATLFRAAGLSPSSVSATSSGVCVLEAVPA